jgi:dephospho-CoA kinase
MTSQRSRPYAVALTGGIGSGKSAVADLFGQHGVGIIDADAVSHALTGPGGVALAPIAARFGSHMLHAEHGLDRAALRDLVFSNADARRDLEAILHPMIRTRMQDALVADAGPYALLAIPLLIETGQTTLADRILVVDAPEDLRIERVRRRSGLDADAVRRIMASQASRAERLAAADDVLDNSGSLAELEPRVEQLHRRYLQLACRPRR